MTLTALLSGCSSLLYYPSKESLYPPSRINLKPDEVLLTPGEHQIQLWRFKNLKKKAGKAVFVQFHGNAQNMSSHYLSLVWLLQFGYDLITFDYQGYGQSTGEPSPENTVTDGIEVLRWAKKNYPNTPIILVGQSLGGPIALKSALMSQHEIQPKLILIDSSFSSYRAAARSVLSKNALTWILQPFTYLLLSDRFAPGEDVAQLSPIPLIIIHGDHDQTIDIQLGIKLFEQAKEPKEFWKVPGGQHLDAFWRSEPNLRKRLLEYLNQLLQKE